MAGDLTKDEAKAAMEMHFGHWKTPAGHAKVRAVVAKDPANKALRVVVVNKADAVQTVVQFYMPGPKYSDPRRIRFNLLNTILGGSFTSRLNQNLRERNGYTYGARSRFAMSPSTGYLLASSNVQADVTGAALQEFLKEFARIRAGDISTDEARKTRETNRMSKVQ